MNGKGIRVRRISATLGAGALLAVLTGCGGSHPTCQEYAGMEETTGLFSSYSDAQSDVMDKALRAEDFMTTGFNRTIAHTEIIAYCNIYEGVANSNHDRPITEAIRE